MDLASLDFGKNPEITAVMNVIHPITGEEMEWHSPIPPDMVELVEVLRLDSAEHPDDIVWI